MGAEKILVGLADSLAGGNPLTRKILTANEINPAAKAKVAELTYGDGDGVLEWEDVETAVETVGDKIGDIITTIAEWF